MPPAPDPSPRPVRLSVRGGVEPFHVMEVIKAATARQASHGDVIALCAGQPSTPAPQAARAAAVRALDGEVLGYTEATGIRPLRAAVARHYGDTYGLAVDPDQVVITTGSSAAFTALFLAAFDVGDTVAMSRPGYPAYQGQGYPAYQGQGAGQVAPRNVTAIVLLIISAVSTFATGIIGPPSLVMALLALKHNSTEPARASKLANRGWIVYAINALVGLALLVAFFWLRAKR